MGYPPPTLATSNFTFDRCPFLDFQYLTKSTDMTLCQIGSILFTLAIPGDFGVFVNIHCFRHCAGYKNKKKSKLTLICAVG